MVAAKLHPALEGVAEDDLLDPSKLGRVGQLLGRGGWGSVYHAVYDGQPCALKVFSPVPENRNSELLPQQMASFVREALAGKRCEHKHLVRCMGVMALPPRSEGNSSDVPALAQCQELCEAGTTRALIIKGMMAGGRVYTNLQALRWLEQVASALLYLHTSSPPIIHRDVKQENIVLVQKGNALIAKLADMGLHVEVEGDRTVMLRRKQKEGASVHNGGAGGGDGHMGTGPDASHASHGPGASSDLSSSSAASPFLKINRDSSASGVGSSTSVISAAGSAPSGLLPVRSSARGSASHLGAILEGQHEGDKEGSRHAGSAHAAAVVTVSPHVPPQPPLATPGLLPGASAPGNSDGGASASTAEGSDVQEGLGNGDGHGHWPGHGGAPPAASSAAPSLTLAPPRGASTSSTPPQIPGSAAVSLTQPAPPALALAKGSAALMSVAGLARTSGDGAGSARGDGESPSQRPSLSGVASVGSRQSLGGTGSPVAEERAPSGSSSSPPPLDAAAVSNGANAGSSGAATAPAAAKRGPLPMRDAGSSLYEAYEDASDAFPCASQLSCPAPLPLPPLPGCLQSLPLENVSMAAAAAAAGAPAAGASSPSPASPLVAMTSLSDHARWTPDQGEQSPSNTAPTSKGATGTGMSGGSPAQASHRGTDGGLSGITGNTSMLSVSQLPAHSSYSLTSGGGAEGRSSNRLSLAQFRSQSGAVSVFGPMGGGAGSVPPSPGQRSPTFSAPGLPPTASLTSTPSQTRTFWSSLSLNLGRLSNALRHPSSSVLQPVNQGSFTRNSRRVKSILVQFRRPTLPDVSNASAIWVFGLTGQAGSLFSMAPEVYRELPYNHKADVFSFGAVMYELLSRELLATAYIGTRRGMELGIHEPEHYAEKVCQGFRPPQPKHVSSAAWDLLSRCWADDPVTRPDMQQVSQELEALIAEAEAAGEAEGGGGCSCTIC